MGEQRSEGFWAEGIGQLLSALRSEEREAIAELERRLGQSDDEGERAELQAERRRLRREFRRKKEEARGHLYLGS